MCIGRSSALIHTDHYELSDEYTARIGQGVIHISRNVFEDALAELLGEVRSTIWIRYILTMDVRTLKTLKDEYPTSSWALWSSEFPDEGCIEDDPEELFQFIKRNRDQLSPSIVLLSLNPSTELPSNYQNFHSTEPKHRNNQFRDLVEEAGLEGAYMTDLVERVVDANSGNVDPTPDDVENLFGQLDLLDRESYHVLCFHEKVYQTLLDYCGSASRELTHDIRAFRSTRKGVPLECYRVWFHANWGANREKIAELQKQMTYLSSEVINGGLADLSQWLD